MLPVVLCIYYCRLYRDTHVCINVRARNTPRHYDSTARTPWIAFVGLALKISEGPHLDTGENESSCVNESDGKEYGKEWT